MVGLASRSIISLYVIRNHWYRKVSIFSLERSMSYVEYVEIIANVFLCFRIERISNTNKRQIRHSTTHQCLDTECVSLVWIYLKKTQLTTFLCNLCYILPPLSVGSITKRNVSGNYLWCMVPKCKRSANWSLSMPRAFSTAPPLFPITNHL